MSPILSMDLLSEGLKSIIMLGECILIEKILEDAYGSACVNFGFS